MFKQKRFQFTLVMAYVQNGEQCVSSVHLC